MDKASDMPYVMSFVMTYSVLGILTFFFTSKDGLVPLSPDAFIQPYTGKFAMASLILSIFAIIELPLYFFWIYPKFRSHSKSRPMVLIFPSVFATLGFMIAFLNQNPWIAMPFMALGFAVFVFAFITTRKAEIQ